MNKKGFTLVELLAVIALIGVIATIAVVSMNGIRNRVDLKLVEGNLNLILVTANQYGETIKNELVSTRKNVKVSFLKENFELDIGSEYDNIVVDISLKNRRSSACISGTSELKNIVGEDNLDSLNSVMCSSLLGDVNNDGMQKCDDRTMLFNYLGGEQVPIYLPNADVDQNGTINNKDTVKLSNILNSLGINCN